jgi:hypothetical protein
VDWLLYMAVPIFVMGIGVFLLQRSADPGIVGWISNRTLGLLALGIGGIDFVVRLLRSTVLQ